MKPAAPTVERGTVLIDTVKRGPMVRDVRGPGTLVPEDILWIQAAFDSQVSKILSQSGDAVNPETVLLVLTNPQMEADTNDLEWQAKQAEANYADLKVRLQSQTFDEQSVVATAQGDFTFLRNLRFGFIAFFLQPFDQIQRIDLIAAFERADTFLNFARWKSFLQQRGDARDNQGRWMSGA